MALATGLKLSIKRIKAKIAAVVETGLATWHKMTANTWTGANRLPDSSTNSNSAALYTGRGLSFDGVNDVVTVGATGQTVRTVVFYAYPDTTTTAFMQLQSSGAVRVEIASGTLSATGFTSPTLYVNGAAGSTVAATTWQQLAVTSATGVSASNVLLGQSNTTYYGGDLSNVKFFSVELSAAQIAELYANPEQVLPTGVSSSELVGWWPMADANEILLDGSGNNNHAIVSGATNLNSVNHIANQIGLTGYNRPMYFNGSSSVQVTETNITALSKVSFYVEYIPASGSVLSIMAKNGTIFYFRCYNTYLSIRIPTSPDLINNPYNYGENIANKYTRILFKVEDGSQKLFSNGTNTNNSTFSVTSFSGAFNFIGSLTSTLQFYKGHIFKVVVYNDALSDSIAADLTSGTINYDDSSISENILSSYLNTGNTISDWVDRSGNGNDAVAIVGSPAKVNLVRGVNSTKDILGYSLQNNNTGELILNADGYALITDAATLDITAAITLEAWVKPFTVSTAQTIIGKNTAYALGLTSAGKPVFTKWTSAASTATATTITALTVNTWHHIAVTYDGTNVKIYIDGAIDTTTAVSGAIDSTSTDVLMGALTTSTELFSGYIDSVKIYSSDLTAAQVAENYNAETAAHSNA